MLDVIPFLIGKKPIDVGSPAVNRASSFITDYTLIDLGNPLNASGTIRIVSIWATTNADGVKVGLFYTNATKYKCRCTAAIGTVTAGAKYSFPVILPGLKGDFIGCYFASGTIERDTTGGLVGIVVVATDHCTVGDDTTYSALSANHAISLYGTGVG
jgi:hypothetical protein